MHWPARPSDDELIAALARHAGGESARATGVRTERLPGGFVSEIVERLDITFTSGDGPPRAAAYVRKPCLEREVRAMAFLPGVAGADAAPELVASWAEDKAGGAAGFVSPFYPGGELHFGDPIPEAVVTTLARIHVASEAAAIDWTWRFDAAKVDRLRDNALQALSTTERFLQRFADPAAWRARLAHTSASPALRQAAETLPRTLTHGDMHPGNLLRRADGSAVIIDWGNVCLAPAMLDLANIVAIGSPLWDAYAWAYRAAGGAFDEAIARRGFWWARAMTAVMYIPWAAANSDRVTDLVEQAEAATAELTALM